MRRSVLFFRVLGVVLGLAACGGSTSSPSGPTAAAACADVANAYCSEFAKCSPLGMAEDYASASSCVTRRTELCENSLAAPGTGATPATTESCVTAYASYSCPDFLDDVVPAACKPVAGTGATGAPCAFAAQCQSAYCATAKGAMCGTCQAAPGSGSPCASVNCPTGLHCAASTETCTTYGAAGAACAVNGDCGAGFDCVGSDAATNAMGKCTAEVETADATCDHALKTGAGCDPTMSLFCGKDDKCDAYGSAASGQACAYVNGAMTYTYCTAGAQCLISTPGVGTCAGPAMDGAACDTASDDGCLPPATCIGSTVDGGVMGTCQIASAGTCH
jgi:hypothetical protein